MTPGSSAPPAAPPQQADRRHGPDPDGKGYWLVASDGGVFTFGDAGFFGSTGACTSTSRSSAWPPTPDGKGYWLVASDGGVFTFGDAGFFGSTGALRLNAPVVGATSTGANGVAP